MPTPFEEALSISPMSKNIMVWVDVEPTTNFTEMFQAKLPRISSWHDVQESLRTAVDVHVAGEGYEFKQQPGGKWKYQLVSRDGKSVVNKSCIYLNTDEDYRELVDTVKGRGKGVPIAVLTQEKAEGLSTSAAASSTGPSSIKAGGQAEADKDTGKRPADEDDLRWEGQTANPLEEDGTPCFDPYDAEEMDRVLVRWAEKHSGFMD